MFRKEKVYNIEYVYACRDVNGVPVMFTNGSVIESWWFLGIKVRERVEFTNSKNSPGDVMEESVVAPVGY